MPNENLDIESPYLRKNIYSTNKREGHFVSLDRNLERSRESSDNLWERKITNISKRVVGEEIRRFSEIASHEISEEFNNLESRIQANTIEQTQSLIETTFKKIESNLHKDIYDKVDYLKESLETNLNSTFQDILSELNKKLEDFEYLSLKINEKISILEEDFKNPIITSCPEEVSEEPIFKIKTSKPTSLTKINDQVESVIILGEDINEAPAVILTGARHELNNNLDGLENFGKIIKKEVAPKVEIPPKDYTSYSSQKDLSKIIALFDKKGFLFNKNNFTTHFKNLKVNDFLQKNNYTSIDKKDEEKMLAILEERISKNNVIPNSTESILDFLTRCSD